MYCKCAHLHNHYHNDLSDHCICDVIICAEDRGYFEDTFVSLERFNAASHWRRGKQATEARALWHSLQAPAHDISICPTATSSLS
jgi:hypothetical protein